MQLRYFDGTDTVSMYFRPIDERDLPNAEREKIRDLRGIDHSFLMSTRHEHTVVISADELQLYSRRHFIEQFWSVGVQWWINLSPNPVITEIGWIEVTIDGGTIPFERIEDLEELPEITLTLTERFPR